MAIDRVPLVTVGGSLSPWIGDSGDFVCALSIGTSYTLKRLFLSVPEALSTGALSASIRSAPSGGGSAITASIASGQQSGVATGSVSLTGTETLYLRINSAPAEAADLSGWFELEFADSVSVVTALTNTTRVKRYLNESSSVNDEVLNELILSVSAAMQAWMNRYILQRSITGEKHDGTGRLDVLNLRDYPVIGISSVTVDDEALAGADYEIELNPGQLYYTPDGEYAAWPAGRRNVVVSYSAGYATVPADLEHAATVQVVAQFKRTAHGGNRLGERQTTIGEAVSQYMVDAWMPEVLEIMRRHQRAHAAA